MINSHDFLFAASPKNNLFNLAEEIADSCLRMISVFQSFRVRVRDLKVMLLVEVEALGSLFADAGFGFLPCCSWNRRKLVIS